MILWCLQERRERCICKLCGGKLEIRLIIYNQYGGQGVDLYCPTCQKVEYGIEPEIYAWAKEFVEKFEFNYYLDMEENQRNHQLNIGKVCEIGAWLFKNAGLLNEEGLKKEVNLSRE
jgi:hypothetical protein